MFLRLFSPKALSLFHSFPISTDGFTISNGVFPPKARWGVLFFVNTGCKVASPHRDSGDPDALSTVRAMVSLFCSVSLQLRWSGCGRGSFVADVSPLLPMLSVLPRSEILSLHPLVHSRLGVGGGFLTTSGAAGVQWPPVFCPQECRRRCTWHVYKDRSLPSLSSLVNTNTLIPITCSAGYRRDLLLFEISDSYCAPIMPLCIDPRYTWNVPSHTLYI